MKNPIIQVTYFLNGPMFNLLFYCHIIFYWEKVTYWSPNCLENFNVLMLQMEVSKCWKIIEFQKTSLRMKNCKTNYSASPDSPHQIKPYYVFGTNTYGDIQKYTDICYQSASRMRLLGVKKWCSANVFFRYQTETYVLQNLRSKKGFWLCCRSILISMWSELRFVQWARFFEGNCTVK